MPLGWEIDDEARIGQPTRLKHKHPSRPHLIMFAGGVISLIVLGVSILELKRNAATHDTDTVDGIDERLDILGKDITFLVFDHINPT
jgi:hypothetical protein